MGDIEYWYKTYSDRVTGYENKVDGIGSVSAGDHIEDQIAACAKVEKKAEKDKRALGMEARLIKDPDTKAQWEGRIHEVDERLAVGKRALTTKKEQAELFGQKGGGAGGVPGHAGPTNDEYLDKTEQVHDKIDDSLANAANLINEAEEVGAATLEALAAQRNQIENIHGTVISIEEALKRSDALLRSFSKRMATDKMIQFFFMINLLGLIGIIVYSVMQDQGLNDDDEAPADDATPTTDDFKNEASGSGGTTTTSRRRLSAWALVEATGLPQRLQGVFTAAGESAAKHATTHFLRRGY
eukprot:CAMPEP_0171606604 /NCGR_PEP_ID=MMETSP0990-20121206/7855_1 /TAXON_ID=483369 /ORGANISM="non described non described, Strain CCMP2098" /LENGTH=297 /DNA_ID=CAMNT_0012169459 /DNA_START=153 /DNA_END=1047 /DNA_ORIENTATION=-